MQDEKGECLINAMRKITENIYWWGQKSYQAAVCTLEKGLELSQIDFASKVQKAANLS